MLAIVTAYPSFNTAPASVAELTSRGILRQHVRTMPASLPGEVGSGYRSGPNLAHVEPEDIWVLGTSHVSEQSAHDVEAAVAALQPDAIVLELCRSRTGLLYADEAPSSDRAGNAFGLSGAEGGALRAMQRSVALGGWTALLLRSFLARLSENLGGTLKVTPGADFRAAKRMAEASNATLVLGDRPVEITLERCWDALGGRQRWEVITALGAGLLARPARESPERRSEMQALLDQALGAGGERGADGGVDGAEGADGQSSPASSAATLDSLEAALGGRFPSLVAPLISERDIFLSLTIKSSYAVSGKRRVLAVVGAGHLDGVMAALGQEHTGAFKALTTTPRRVRERQKLLGVVPRPLATRLVVDATVGLAAWSWWSASQQ